ncbi:MAG: hypothetical protein ACD_67C00043G0003 [uncultured bacterium]|nr:MAG: hypothetical protein ACD_67C00043G0003 [uncultured bacterium]
MKNFEPSFSFPEEKEILPVKPEVLPSTETEKAPNGLKEISQRENKLIEHVAEKFCQSSIDLRKRSAKLLTAFLIFMGSTTAYAEGVAEKTEAPNKDDQNISQMLVGSHEKQDSKFDWKKAIEKIELSVSGRFENVRDYKTSMIRAEQLQHEFKKILYYDTGFKQEDGTPLVKQLNKGTASIDNGPEFEVLMDENYIIVENATLDHGEVVAKRNNYFTQIYLETVKNAGNSNEFLAGLGKNTENLSSGEKSRVLQRVASALYGTYNFDMLKKGDHVAISDEETFKVLQRIYVNDDSEALLNPGKLGICGNISTQTVKAAKSMGLEAWTQSGESGGSTHVWTGMITDNNGEKEIVFMQNNGDMIPTGTLNYKDALGIIERSNESVSALNNFVGNENETLFSVESRAQENVLVAANVERTEKILEQNITAGEFTRDRGLEIAVSPDVQEFVLTREHVGLAMYNFIDTYDNPYQAMQAMQALRVNTVFSGEHLAIEGDVTVMHVDMKNFTESSGESYVDLLGRFAVSAIDNGELTKGEYGKLVLNYGTTLQAAIKNSLRQKNVARSTEVMGEGSVGARLTYFNPNESGKFYMGVSDVVSFQTDNAQEQNIVPVESLRNFKIGANVKVNEATILNADATRNEYQWGNENELKIGMETENFVLGGEYEKADSQFERFYPDSEKITGKVGYKKNGWEVDLIGFKEVQQYASADKADNYGAEVKLKIVLWP